MHRLSAPFSAAETAGLSSPADPALSTTLFTSGLEVVFLGGTAIDTQIAFSSGGTGGGAAQESRLFGWHRYQRDGQRRGRAVHFVRWRDFRCDRLFGRFA